MEYKKSIAVIIIIGLFMMTTFFMIEDRERMELIKSGELCIGCEVDETVMDFGAEEIDIVNFSEFDYG